MSCLAQRHLRAVPELEALLCTRVSKPACRAPVCRARGTQGDWQNRPVCQHCHGTEPKLRSQLAAGATRYPSLHRLLVSASRVGESSCWHRKGHENLFCIIIWLRSQIQYFLLQPSVFRLINQLFQDIPSASFDKIQYCCLRWEEHEQDPFRPAQTLSYQTQAFKSANLPSCLQEWPTAQ